MRGSGTPSMELVVMRFRERERMDERVVGDIVHSFGVVVVVVVVGVEGVVVIGVDVEFGGKGRVIEDCELKT